MENKYFPSKKGEVIPKEAIVSRTEQMYPEKGSWTTDHASMHTYDLLMNETNQT